MKHEDVRIGMKVRMNGRGNCAEEGTILTTIEEDGVWMGRMSNGLYAHASWFNPVKSTKNTIIHTEKVWKDGKKSRRITGWENVENFLDLPLKYRGPHHLGAYFGFKKSPNKLGIEKSGSQIVEDEYITKGDIILEEDYQKLIKFMKAAGERLATIRRKERKEKAEKEWSGIEDVEI